MTNKIKIISLILLLFTSIFVFSACNSSNSHVHNYDEWTVIKAATCTNPGEEARYCSCGDTQTRTTAFAPHTYGEWTVSQPATCTSNGIQEKVCSCGEKETQTISASGHTFSTWNTTKEATCTVNGSKERSCACGEKETETIIASHAWKDATCTEAKNCSKCGLTDGSALGHTCSVGTCTRCNTTVHPTVKLPSTPMTVWYYNRDSMKITELSYEFNSSGDLIISFSGEKTYGKDSELIAFNYKVLDENGYVLYTYRWVGDGYNTGDKFKNKTLQVYSSYLNGASEYTIVISDYN